VYEIFTKDEVIHVLYKYLIAKVILVEIPAVFTSVAMSQVLKKVEQWGRQKVDFKMD